MYYWDDSALQCHVVALYYMGWFFKRVAFYVAVWPHLVQFFVIVVPWSWLFTCGMGSSKYKKNSRWLCTFFYTEGFRKERQTDKSCSGVAYARVIRLLDPIIVEDVSEM